MGSNFQDLVDYNRVAISIELLEWGCTFSVFWGKTVLYIYKTHQNVFTVGETESVLHSIKGGYINRK